MAICENCIHDEVCGLEGHLDEALTFCDNKAADAQSVKHGRWELTNNLNFRKCSGCGAWWDTEFTTNNYVNYCPRCGAKMGD